MNGQVLLFVKDKVFLQQAYLGSMLFVVGIYKMPNHYRN